MPVSFDLPADIENALRTELGDLDSQAKEAFAVELYRKHKLTHYQLSRLLGMDRYQTDELLKRCGVHYELTADDVAQEADELGRLRHP